MWQLLGDVERTGPSVPRPGPPNTSEPIGGCFSRGVLWGMHGLNVVAPYLDDSQVELEVSEIFHTLQGEGPFAGEPAVFVRLAGCNLQCTFCDTDFEEVKDRITADEVVRRVRRVRLREGPCGLVVITGGEPMRQNIAPLIERLCAGGFRVQIETAGTLWRPSLEHVLEKRSRSGTSPGNFGSIVCSPKTARLAPGIGRFIHALKYICRAGEMCVRDGLPVKNTQAKGRPEVRPIRPYDIDGSCAVHPSQIFIQPCYTGDKVQDAKNLVAATQIALRKGYRLSVQLHRIARVP